MKYIKKISTAMTATGLGALLATGLTGCGEDAPKEVPKEQPAEKKSAFVIIEETEAGKYKIKDEFPADETRIILKKLDGTEQVLTQEEMDALVKAEAAKIEDGTSTLTQPPAEQASSGMSLGETLLASAAGAMLGAYIGNKLFGNQNYQNNRKAGYKSPSTFSRSNSSFGKNRATTSSSTKSSSSRSGFFNKKKATTSSRSSLGG